jgi:hypothetical protein
MERAQRLYRHRCYGYRDCGRHLYADGDESHYGLYGYGHRDRDLEYDGASGCNGQQ